MQRTNELSHRKSTTHVNNIVAYAHILERLPDVHRQAAEEVGLNDIDVLVDVLISHRFEIHNIVFDFFNRRDCRKRHMDMKVDMLKLYSI